MNSKIVVAIVVVIVIVAGGYGIYTYYNKENKGVNEQAMETLPDVVARVNGVNISRAELEVFEEQVATSQGFEASALNTEQASELHTHAVNELIARELLRQVVEMSGIEATPESVDEQMASFRAQFQNDEDYQVALAAQGITEQGLRERVTRDFTAQTYLDQILDLDSITATDAEIESSYNEEAQNAGDDFPPLSEVRDQVESFVISEKRQAKVAEHLAMLRSEAEVEVLI